MERGGESGGPEGIRRGARVRRLRERGSVSAPPTFARSQRGDAPHFPASMVFVEEGLLCMLLGL